MLRKQRTQWDGDGAYDRGAAAFGDLVGATRPGFDQPFSAQSVEDGQVEVGKDHSVARDACHGRDLWTVVPFVQNAAAKGQNVQSTLFMS